MVAVSIKLGLGCDPEALLADVLGKHLTGPHLTAVGTAKQGAALEVTYAGRLRHPAAAVSSVAELNRLDGVQGVELH